MLGVEVHGSSLPATVICPLCQHQALGVYKEPAKPGQWYHCVACGFAGDGVELTAAVDGISSGSAILKLSARGLPIPAEFLEPGAINRQTKRIDRRKRITAFWNAARASTDNTGNTGPAQRQLGIAPGAMHAPEWSRRGGRFVGYCQANDIEALLRPGVLNHRFRVGRAGTGNAGWRPIFSGTGWRDLLIVAYHGMLGRVSGFLIIGREARWPDDFVFASTQPSDRVLAFGVAMLEAAMPVHREFGSSVLVLEDPVLAVRIQLRHLVSTDTPLPVVGAWGRPETRPIWTSLPQRDLVHWASEPSGSLIARARQSGGRVALAPSGPAIVGHLERSRPVLALRGMVTAARPWDAALETLLGRLAPAKAEELVLSLKLRPDETTGFLRACADDTRARLAALFVDTGRPRGVTISGKTVTESGGAWRVAKTGELVCDAILRVEQVIRSMDGKVSYRGRIEYKGQTLSFCVPDTEIEKDPLKWIKTQIGKARLGEVVTGTRYWSRYLLAIAQQFEPPRPAKGLDKVGWDDKRNAFTLPRFVLQGNGEIVSPDYTVPTEVVLPAAHLTPPEGLTPGSRTALAWGDEANELFWATATCLLTDILAPALGFPRTSTALVGPGAISVGTATAIAFGCPTARVPGQFKSILPAEARQLMSAHCWPILARRPPEDTTQDVIWRALSQFPSGVIAAASTWAADTLLITGGWHTITGSNPAVQNRAMEHGGTILKNYLKDLCDRRLNLVVQGSLLDAIHADLAAWYGRVATSRSIERSRRYICADDPTAHPDRFGRLICRLISSGDLHLAKPGTNDRQVITLLSNDRVHIPKWSVNESLASRQATPLDASIVSAELRKAGILLDERDQDYMAGWIVSAGWLRQCENDRQRENRSDVRVVI